MKKQAWYLFPALLFIVLALPVAAQDLVIIHTNDLHSQIEPFKEGRNAGTGGILRV